MAKSRSAVEPEDLLRMLVAGYLYGNCSERRLKDKINSNFACRWFYGLG